MQLNEKSLSLGWHRKTSGSEYRFRSKLSRRLLSCLFVLNLSALILKCYKMLRFFELCLHNRVMEVRRNLLETTDRVTGFDRDFAVAESG